MNWAHKKVKLDWNYLCQKFVVKTTINTFFVMALKRHITHVKRLVN